MSREKQIGEMASLIYAGSTLSVSSVEIAAAMYEQGYRKTTVGKWKKVSEKYPQYVCTVCAHLHNNKAYKFCPNCGAKMKGVV